MRQIILDTETTGLSAAQGHRIIEIGCVEMINRRLTGKTFHYYLQPDREVDPGAMKVHGITNQFLKDKPRFHQIADDFKQFIYGAELIIHNATFDVSFIENEFRLLKDEQWEVLDRHCTILDTLMLARQKHPGQRNNLDALCSRYGVSNEHRDKHGALLDSEILAEVYLAMTGGQETLSLDENAAAVVAAESSSESMLQVTTQIYDHLVLVSASAEELTKHETFVQEIEKKSGQPSRWRD